MMNVRSWVGSVLLTAVVASMNAVGCSHEIDSPPATASSPVTPDLACVAQLTTLVSLKGTGFTPMPSKTLSGPEQLILPKVTLKRDVDLDNQPQSDLITVPDDPANPSASHVHWTSETQMAFDVYPGEDPANGADKGNLPTGLYDITVTNPDGKQAASFAAALGAVPPPSITKIVPPAICDEQANQTMEIDGANFLKVGNQLPTITVGTQTFTATAVSNCKPVPGTYVEGDVEECSTLTFTIPQGTFQPGDYPVTVTNPPPANCVSSETIVLHDEPPPIVTKVTGKICQGGGTLTVDGSNFIATPTVSLEAQNQPTVSSSSVTMTQPGTELTANIPGGLTVGQSYDVVVTNPDGCSDTPPHQQVTVQAGPVIYWADPYVVYNGVAMVVTVYMTEGFNSSDTVDIVPTGQTTPVTALTPQPVAGHANRFTVTIPAGQAPGTYDLILHDPSGCSAILTQAIIVTHDLTIAVKNVVPPFGWTSSETDVTIYRDPTAATPLNHPFIATPRAFLNPHNAQPTDTATPLVSVSFVDQNTLTAVVPTGMKVGAYDLVVTDPDGTVGFLPNAFTVTTNAPPVITSLVPSSIVAAAGQAVTVNGTDFRTGATVTVTCKDAANNTFTPTVATGTVSCSGTNCSVVATIDGSTLTGMTDPAVCIVRLTNTDGTYADYSALGVTNTSFNLEKPTISGTNMTVARRALVSSAIDATSAARFIYAIGGDNGTTAQNAPYDSTEFASVDLYGKMGTWQKQKYTLPVGRSFAGSVKLGRYTYVFGGTSDATKDTSTLNTGIRAITLSPRETPILDVSDVYLCAGDVNCTTGPGLAGGFWYYRVSAVFDSTANGEIDNPLGESLASDELPLKLPTFAGKQLQVKLSWSAPVDSLGNPLPHVTNYRIYRTAAANDASGGEVLLATVGNVTTYLDDGSATPGTDTPLPLGSMGQWAPLPNMGTARKGLGAAIAVDPSAANTYYAYALLGLDGTGAVLKSYEYLPITVLTNGHQTFGSAWTPGGSSVATGRWQIGAWTADALTAKTITGTTSYVYLGGGYAANATTGVTDVDVGKVAAGGSLGTIVGLTDTNNTSASFKSSLAGYGVCAAVNQLFTLGGKGATISQGGTSAMISSSPPQVDQGAWNAEGIQLAQPRYLMGSTVQSAFIFLTGGDTGGGTATASTEAIVW